MEKLHIHEYDQENVIQVIKETIKKGNNALVVGHWGLAEQVVNGLEEDVSFALDHANEHHNILEIKISTEDEIVINLLNFSEEHL